MKKINITKNFISNIFLKKKNIRKRNIRKKNNKVRSNTVNSNMVRSNMVNSNTVRSNTVNSNMVNSNMVNSNTVRSNTVNSNMVNSNTVNSNRVKSNTIKSNTVKSNTVKSNTVKINTVKSNTVKINTVKSNTVQINTGRSNTGRSNTGRNNTGRNNTGRNNIVQKKIKKLSRRIYTSIIPLNIFQTWHTLELPNDMKNNIEKIKLLNPEFKYYIYDDEMCREFIKNNFDNNVRYAFDKIKPGAFKADLWRYCILYKYGGIYLDIKYNCINNFKLIYLTDQEYYVKDIDYSNEKTGIYNALLISSPNNQILLNCINDIVYNCMNNNIGKNPLEFSGPDLMAKYFEQSDIIKFNLKLYKDGKTILYNKVPVLQVYNNYRKEQKKYQKNTYYSILWKNKNIFNYPILKNKKIILDYNNNLEIELFKYKIILKSSTPNILYDPNTNKYIVFVKFINYNDTNIYHIYNLYITKNLVLELDNDFNILEQKFIEDNICDEYKQKYLRVGIQDIRLFNYNNKIYFSADHWNNLNKSISTIIGTYNDYKLEWDYTYPCFYDNKKEKHSDEKNWAFFTMDDNSYIIYKWFPLNISKIDFENKKLDLDNLIINYNIPESFKDINSNTHGFTFKDTIWFVCHKLLYITNKKNYLHLIVVFDLKMNLIKYSELFKFDDDNIEMCSGLIVNDDNIIMTYSNNDITSKIVNINKNDLFDQIKFFDNTLQ